jgi:hypothetical protein
MCVASRLLQAYAALVERFGRPAVVKNRLLEAPHDVLVVVWYEGALCEVQFHLEQVFALKAGVAFFLTTSAFLHAA